MNVVPDSVTVARDSTLRPGAKPGGPSALWDVPEAQTSVARGPRLRKPGTPPIINALPHPTHPWSAHQQRTTLDCQLVPGSKAKVTRGDGRGRPGQVILLMISRHKQCSSRAESSISAGSAAHEVALPTSALLVMDRVTLEPPWRGHGLAAVLACEAITRLMAGCRAVACSPGITDLSSQRLTDKAEWDRVNARIAHGWERLGFRPYRDNVYLLSPASQDLEEQRGALRRHLADLGASWRTDAS